MLWQQEAVLRGRFLFRQGLNLHDGKTPCCLAASRGMPLRQQRHLIIWRRRRDSRLAAQGSTPSSQARSAEFLKTLHWSVFLTEFHLRFESPSICNNKKAGPFLDLRDLSGGGGGIRTLVTLSGQNGFRDRRIQPLCHPSMLVKLLLETSHKWYQF